MVRSYAGKIGDTDGSGSALCDVGDACCCDSDNSGGVWRNVAGSSSILGAERARRRGPSDSRAAVIISHSGCETHRLRERQASAPRRDTDADIARGGSDRDGGRRCARVVCHGGGRQTYGRRIRCAGRGIVSDRSSGDIGECATGVAGATGSRQRPGYTLVLRIVLYRCGERLCLVHLYASRSRRKRNGYRRWVRAAERNYLDGAHDGIVDAMDELNR